MADHLVPAREQGLAVSHPADAALGAFGGSQLGGEEPSGVDWRRMLGAVLRYKWLVLGTTALGAAVGWGLSRVVPPVYEAQATIWVPAVVQSGRDQGGPIQQQPLFTTIGWVELIKTSFVVLDDVVRDLRLYVTPKSDADTAALATLGVKSRFAPGSYEVAVSPDGRSFEFRSGQGTTLQRGAVGDSIGAALGLAWVPPAGTLQAGQEVAFSLIPPRDAAVQLQRDIGVLFNEQGANFLAVRLEGPNPKLLAATVNGVARGFVDTARTLTNARQRELIRALSGQLATAEERLRTSEIALEQFRVETITLPSEPATPIAPGLEETRNPVMTSFFNMKTELDGIQQDRAAIERALAAAPDGEITPDALLYIRAVQQSSDLSRALADLTTRQAELTTLRLRYTDVNPDVQRAAEQIKRLQQRTIPDLARALLAQMAGRERELQSRIGSASRELQAIPRRSIEEQRLRRQVDIDATAYQDLKARYQDAVFAESASDLGARVLDPAIVPQRPVTDTAIRLFGMALVAGLGLGLLGAVLLDRIDRRVRYPEQVTHGLGLPILGAVPRMKAGGNGKLAKPSETLQVIEALRGIRLGMVHAHGSAGPLMVTVTSPGPGEGKSFVVSNLALAFADAGHRTIVIDGDVRRGELHRLLGLSRKPGLTDFLKGTVSRDDVLQQTRYPSLHFVGGGTRMGNAPELLASPALSQLLLMLRSAYDVILVDSPPLGAGVDPYVLGAATGNILLVLRTGVTDRELAEAKLDMLDRLPVRVLGAILNDVHPTGHYRYYGYHYYAEGYEARDEAEEQAAEKSAALPAERS